MINVKEVRMFKQILVTTTTLLAFGTAQAGLFDQLQKLGNQIQMQNPSTGGAPAGGAKKNANGESTMDQICNQQFGAAYTGQFPAGKSAEDMVGQYFKVSADLSKKLKTGLATMHKGSMVNLRYVVGDLRDKKVESLARTFLDDPNMQNLGFIVALAQKGDGYKPEDGPSELTEAKTLLALTILQYSDLALDKGQAAVMLRENFMAESGLSIALLARFHLFGDYLNQNMSAFDNYIGQASSKYPVKLADQTIFYALKNIPNWAKRDQYNNLLKQSKDMQASFTKQQGSAKASANLRGRIVNLMQEGDRINAMTLEALGAGPLVAQYRAKGERMKAEAGGNANLVEVFVTNQEAYLEETNKLLLATPQLSGDARAKLKEANDLRAKNISESYAITGQIAMLFFSGNFNETMELGGSVNRYFADSCKATLRMSEFSKQAGVPESTAKIDANSEL
jgi:hypothetical protein